MESNGRYESSLSLDAQEMILDFESALIRSNAFEWLGVIQADDKELGRRWLFYIVERPETTAIADPNTGVDIIEVFSEMALSFPSWLSASLYFLRIPDGNPEVWRGVIQHDNAARLTNIELVRELSIPSLVAA